MDFAAEPTLISLKEMLSLIIILEPPAAHIWPCIIVLFGITAALSGS